MVSNIKHLIITKEYKMTSVLLLFLFELLKEIAYVSSLTIDEDPIRSNKIHLLTELFSDLEQLQCCRRNLGYELVLTHCSKLSLVNITTLSRGIQLWFQMNAWKFNVYCNFKLIIFFVNHFVFFPHDK